MNIFNHFFEKQSLSSPVIIQAPMAGGYATPELVAAVCNAGQLGAYGVGLECFDDFKRNLTEIKKLTNRPFILNFFVPELSEPNREQVSTYQEKLNRYRNALELSPVENIAIPNSPDFDIAQHVELALDQGVLLFSFAFGIPSKKIINRLKQSGAVLFATANNILEAKLLLKVGIDILIAQGLEAGGHQTGFNDSLPKTTTSELVTQLVTEFDAPVIASGGIMNAHDISNMLNSGASACQMGTAFLSTKESGAPEVFKQALTSQMNVEHDPTTLTNAYSGTLDESKKLARCLKNSFTSDFETYPDYIPPFPLPLILNADIRQKSIEINNTDTMVVWCGQNVNKITEGLTATQLINKLLEPIR